jgi:asparagine synthase (glutamine-hydrolysing)
VFRYIALIWNPTDPREFETVQLIERRIAERVPTLQQCFQADGLRVLCSEIDRSGLKIYPMTAHSGLVLGRLFRRSSDINDDCPAPEGTFDSTDEDRIIASPGRSRVTQYWGDYVAFLVDKSSAAKWIIKDPTGNLPCFRTSWRHVDIIFSCLSDCIDLGLPPFTINWSYVASGVGSGGYDSSMQPLNEVSEIHRGECLEIASDGQSAVKLYWQPTFFAERACAIENPSAAAVALRATVLSATRALARSHETILMRLSGGLDSSIISGCLKDVQPRPMVTSYTYFAPQGRSDERRWARLAADYAASDHIELAMDPSSTRLESLTRLRPSVSPIPAFTHLKLAEMERGLAQSNSYTAVFCGDGGDSGLGGECIPLAVDDFIRLKGLARGLLQLASQVALRTDALAWRVLRDAMRRRLTGSRMRDYRDKLLLGTALATTETRGIGLTSESYPHPWFKECKEVPWHIVNRLGNLTGSPDFYGAFVPPTSFSPFVASPLYAQPVVELCLRIPVFTHFHNGRERGLARQAFKHEVPALILQRQWKDRAPRAFEEIVSRNRNFIREMLLGGALCSHRFLDAGAIDAVLSGELNTRQFLVGELMRHLNLELWIRSLAENRVQTLAA